MVEWRRITVPGGYIVALQNGNKIIAEQRRQQVIQMKMAGETEQEIADQLGVSKAQVWNDVKRRLAEVRRDDKEAVQQEYNLQRSRYERLLLRWWSQATGSDDTQAARATGIVLDILRRLDTIGGLVPDKPLIQLQQQNVMVGGVTFADLLREAMGGQVVEGIVCDDVDPS
jgi:DNA-binding CsgD family transcriptional regulator